MRYKWGRKMLPQSSWPKIQGDNSPIVLARSTLVTASKLYGNALKNRLPPTVVFVPSAHRTSEQPEETSSALSAVRGRPLCGA